VDFNFELQPFD